jgi:methionine aminopeptidase
MKPASRIVAEILLELREVVRDGITTAEIDRLAEEKTLKRNAKRRSRVSRFSSEHLHLY